MVDVAWHMIRMDCVVVLCGVIEMRLMWRLIGIDWVRRRVGVVGGHYCDGTWCCGCRARARTRTRATCGGEIGGGGVDVIRRRQMVMVVVMVTRWSSTGAHHWQRAICNSEVTTHIWVILVTPIVTPFFFLLHTRPSAKPNWNGEKKKCFVIKCLR